MRTPRFCSEVSATRAAVDVADERGLGDLDFEPAGGEARMGQDRQDLLRHARVLQLMRRNVQREMEVAGPAARVGAGVGEHMVEQLRNHAAFFGDRYELLRLDRAFYVMVPTSENFEADQAALGKRDDRLIMRPDRA